MIFYVDKAKVFDEMEGLRQDLDIALTSMHLAKTTHEYDQAVVQVNASWKTLLEFMDYMRLVDEDGTIGGYTLFSAASKYPATTGALSAFLSTVTRKAAPAARAG